MASKKPVVIQEEPTKGADDKPAGEFAKLFADDPMRPEIHAHWNRPEARAKREIMLQELREKLAAGREHVEGYLDINYPESMEEWEALAYMAKLPVDLIESGNWNPRMVIDALTGMKAGEEWLRRVVPDNPPTKPVEQTKPELPPVDDEDVAILRFLEKWSPQLRTTYDIEAATKITRKTIGKRLVRMRELKFVDRPNGEKIWRAFITAAGKEFLAKLPRAKVTRSLHHKYPHQVNASGQNPHHSGLAYSRNPMRIFHYVGRRIHRRLPVPCSSRSDAAPW